MLRLFNTHEVRKVIELDNFSDFMRIEEYVKVIQYA